MLLVEPYVRLDSLFGRRGGSTVGISLQGAPRLERQRVHAVRTVALVLAITAASVPLTLAAQR